MLSYECISLNNVQGLDFNLYATLITYLLHTHTKLDLIVRLNLMTKMKLIIFMGIDLASYLTQIRNTAEFYTCWLHQSLKRIKINRAQTKMTSGDKSYSEKKYKYCMLSILKKFSEKQSFEWNALLKTISSEAKLVYFTDNGRQDHVKAEAIIFLSEWRHMYFC